MRDFSVIALFFLLATGYSRSQQISPSPSTAVKPASEKVFTVGRGVTAPVLLPLDHGPFLTEKCRKKMDGKILFSLQVDTAGEPRDIVLLEPLGTELGQFARKIVEADRFNPGIRDGVQVAVEVSLEVNMRTCVEQTEEEATNKKYRLQLRSEPVQKFKAVPRPEEPPTFDKAYVPPTSIDGVRVYRVGKGVSSPIPVNNAEAEFSDEARRAKFQGICIVSVIVDAEGKPRNLHVVKDPGMGLGEKSMEAVSQWRFKPAMKDGVPVPVSIMIEVAFRLY